MGYVYLEHGADIGLRAEGASIEEAIAGGAEGLFGLAFNLTDISETIAVTFSVTADDIPLLFVEVLNEALSIQDYHALAFKALTDCGVTETGGVLRFIGTLRGEALDLEKHEVKTEVKAATYCGLEYKKEDNLHILQCLLDV